MSSRVKVAVLGAHLSGMPLNKQMTERNATLVRTTRTAPIYRFYALPNTTPPKPGLIRVNDGPGHAIELEVWEMPVEAYGSFVAGIGAPLCIGTLQLEDGQSVQGFVCESYAIAGATDISSFGGWRAYVASKKA
jgi:allophanate hydrolase